MMAIATITRRVQAESVALHAQAMEMIGQMTSGVAYDAAGAEGRDVVLFSKPSDSAPMQAALVEALGSRSLAKAGPPGAGSDGGGLLGPAALP